MCLRDVTMKIAEIEVAWIQLPLAAGRGLSGGPITSSTDLICRVTTTDGVRGIGEARGAPLPLMAEVVNEGLRPLLLGEDAAATQHLRRKIDLALFDPAGDARRQSWTRNTLLVAIAPVDLALWE